ncbi:MAG: hypothetical protein IJ845_09915 [Bacteroidaceae bacterium]|nr:hypothetical protein [Bacteroidaceae bacterium]
MKPFFKDFAKYYIGIRTADGRNHCIRGWYLDQRFDHGKCPKGYYMYEFREDPEDEDGYIAYIEPFVWCDHSGTFVTRTRIPFGENGNMNVFEIRYGHFY